VGWGFPPLEDLEAGLWLLSRRNPFQGGMGISTELLFQRQRCPRIMSQSLSGWDGDFHPGRRARGQVVCLVAIPFRVGWGFPQMKIKALEGRSLSFVAIPFRVGWGFPQAMGKTKGEWIESRNPFQGGMGISTSESAQRCTVPERLVAIPFRVGWGFPLRRKG